MVIEEIDIAEMIGGDQEVQDVIVGLDHDRKIDIDLTDVMIDVMTDVMTDVMIDEITDVLTIRLIVEKAEGTSVEMIHMRSKSSIVAVLNVSKIKLDMKLK